MEAAPVGCFMMLAVPGDVFSGVITQWVDNRPNDWMIMESSILRRSALSVKALSLWICHIFSLLSRLLYCKRYQGDLSISKLWELLRFATLV